MPGCRLLGSIIISVASLAVAQSSNSAPPSSTQTVVATEVSDGVHLARSSGVPDVNSDTSVPSTTGPVPVASANAVSTPQTTSRLSQKEELFEFDRYPRLEVILRFNLNGAGFGPSESVSGGTSIESKHFILEGRATYNNARKTNDGTVNNKKGHIRSLEASAYYRLPNYWFVGSGAGWGQLSTTNYKKEARGISFGGGSDFIAQGAGFRLYADYTPPVFDHVNGSQGVYVEFTDPSPLRQKHWMFVVSTSTQFFHQTIVDPTDPVLTAKEKSRRSFATTSSFGLRFRF